jgi:hypothetical protein
MSAFVDIVCFVCNEKAIIVEESRYNGLRGMCKTCGGNWPES